MPGIRPSRAARVRNPGKRPASFINRPELSFCFFWVSFANLSLSSSTSLFSLDRSHRYWKREQFIQNVQFGVDNRCGSVSAQPTTTSFVAPSNSNNDEPDDIIIQSKTFYTSETFIISLICGILASLIIGFFVGLMSNKHLNKMDVRRPGDDEEHSNICHYEDIDPRFAGIRAHHLNLGTNSANSSQINFSQNSKLPS